MTERRYLYVYRGCSAFQLALSSYANQLHRIATPGSCRVFADIVVSFSKNSFVKAV